jgi:uncharacterized protein (DUF302 family)
MQVTRSNSGYGETEKRLLEAIANRGLKLFAQIDHAAAAREVGLQMAPEQVVVFGGPKAGTPLMQTDPRIGIELPLKMLLWEDGEGALLGYNDPLELAQRYDVAQHQQTLEAMSKLLAALTTEASG